MRTLLTVLIASFALGLLATIVVADDKAAPAAATTTISGVLIDQACGVKMLTKSDPEKAAEGHPKSCAMSDSCAKSGYAVISGKDMIKFDDAGNGLAKDFLAKTDKKKDLRVTVEGTQTGDTIAVTSLVGVSSDTK